MDARRAARLLFSFAPVVGLLARPELRPQGISAIVRVRGDEEWIEPAVLSIRDFADEILVLDNGAAPRARAAIERLQAKLGERLVRVDCPLLDIFDVSNLGLARARYRFIVRWDADFVGHTDGPGNLAELRQYLVGLDRRRYFAVRLPAAEVAGDLRHQFPDCRIRHDGMAHTASARTRFVRVQREATTATLAIAERVLRARPRLAFALESLALPRYYAVVTWPRVAYFHVHVKPAAHLLLRHFWLEWLAEPDTARYPSLESYALEQARIRWGIADADAAAAHLMRELWTGLVPFDASLCGPYPELLREYVDENRYAVEYAGGRIVGRREVRP
jgi:glycosyltransferase involved in cell wall biosynthesis